MVISDENRARFEGIGVEPIRREFAVGNVFYLHGPEMRSQAREWVAEQEAKLKKEINTARRRERWKFIATLLVSIVAPLPLS